MKPRRGTGEWSDRTVNACVGCAHNCIYCYAAARMAELKKRPRDQWQVESPRPVKGRVYHQRGVTMFPSTHDITPTNQQACRDLIRLYAGAGNHLLIVSKPDPAVWLGSGGLLDYLARLSADRFFGQGQPATPGQAYDRAFTLRFTIGALSQAAREIWEPSAPSFSDQIFVLKQAYVLGFATGVSCEPLLEPWAARALVEAVLPYVSDEVWIGAMNDIKRRVGWRYPMDHPAVQKLLRWQSPAAMRDVFNDLRPLEPIGVSRLRWKDSYQRELGIDEKGRPLTVEEYRSRWART